MNLRYLAANVATASLQRLVGFGGIILSLRLVHQHYSAADADLFVQLSAALIMFQFLDFGIGNAFVNERSANHDTTDIRALLAQFYRLSLRITGGGLALSALFLALSGAWHLTGFILFLWPSVALSLATRYFISDGRAQISNWIYTGIPPVALALVAACCLLEAPIHILLACQSLALALVFGVASLLTTDIRAALKHVLRRRPNHTASLPWRPILAQGGIWFIYQVTMLLGINFDYIIGRNILALPEDFMIGSLLRIAYGLSLVSMISIPIWPWISRSFASDLKPVLQRKLLLSCAAFLVASLSIGALATLVLHLGAAWILGPGTQPSLAVLASIGALVASYNLWFGISSLVTSKDLLRTTVTACICTFALTALAKYLLGAQIGYTGIIWLTSAMLMSWNLFGGVWVFKSSAKVPA